MIVKVIKDVIKVGIPSDAIDKLVKKGLISKDGNDYSVKGNILFYREGIDIKEATKIPSSISWIEEYRSLWPKGINFTSNRSYRGDRKGCIKKMDNFLKNYSFTKEQILEAAAIATKNAASKDFAYFPSADYFIHKEGTGSQLASVCEMLDSDELDVTKPNNITVI